MKYGVRGRINNWCPALTDNRRRKQSENQAVLVNPIIARLLRRHRPSLLSKGETWRARCSARLRANIIPNCTRATALRGQRTDERPDGRYRSQCRWVVVKS